MHPIPVPRAATLSVAAAPAAMLQVAKQGILGEVSEQFGMEEVQATVDTSGASVTYQVPGTVTIPPDGASHKVTVARFSLEPEFDYVSAPRLVEAVYRRAKVINASAYTFLAGQANLFLGEEFIGLTTTRRWPAPVAHAVFTIVLPADLTLRSCIPPPDSVTVNFGKRVYHIERRQFVSDRNLVFRWERSSP